MGLLIAEEDDRKIHFPRIPSIPGNVRSIDALRTALRGEGHGT